MLKMKRMVSALLAAAVVTGAVCAAPPTFADGTDISPLLADSVVLVIGRDTAFVNGEKTSVDAADSSVVPVIRKDRTFVPLRFVSESLGAKVDYNDKDRRVTIVSENTEISVEIGSAVMNINEKPTMLDSEAFILSDRTFVPIRAVSEAFGKKVFYDKRGIIIISDNEISADTDKDAIDALAESIGSRVQALGDFDENGIREADADTYFYNEDAIFRDYLHGVIRPDEGTMEMTFNPLRSMSEMGNDWDFAMGVFTSQVTAGLSINIFAVYTAPKPETGLIFLFKSKTSSQYLKMPDFDWQAGDKFNVAFTWKAGESLCAYKDGELVGSMPMGDGMTEDILPYCFRVPKITPFNVRKIKFSTKAKSAEELDKNTDTDFDIDEDTAFITRNDFESPRHFVTEWQKEIKYTNVTPVWQASKQMFFDDEEVYYPLVAINHSGEIKTYDIRFNVRDNNNILIGDSKVSVTVPPDSKYHVFEVALSQINGANYYNVHADIYDGEEKIFGYDNAIAVINKLDEIPDGELADNFGLQISVDNDFDMMKYLGVSIARAMNAFRWSRVEPTQGNFDFKQCDIYADAMNRLGYDTMAVLGYPPAWASLPPDDEKRAKGKKFSDLPERWQPRSKEEWANYIYTTVSHFKGRIKYWEIYNEINFIFPYSAQTFSGTKEEYYELLHIAYQEAKRADPDCVIVLSGFSAPHKGAVDTDMPMEMIDDRFKDGYFDIYNVHGYLGESSYANEIKALKAKWPKMEYWMGEYMSFQLSGMINRAVEFIKTLSDYAAEGYSKIFSMGVEGSDAVLNRNATASPTESFQGVAVMQKMLSKCDEPAGKVPVFSKSDAMRINHVFKRTDGKYISMLSAYPTEYTLNIANPDAEIYNMFGTKAETEKVGSSTRVLMSDVLYIVTEEPLKITSAVAATSDNLLLNGKFEDCLGDSALGVESLEISNWKVNAEGESRAVPSEDSKSGRFAVKIENASDGKTFVSQKVEGYKPTQYKITARVKKEDPASKVVPYVSMINNDNGKEVMRRLLNVGGDYTEISERIGLPMKTGEGVTFCFGATGGSGSVLIDDAQVVEVSDDGGGDQNLISGGDFEEGIGGWRIVTSADPGGTVSSGTEANSGSKSMYFKSSGEGSVYAVQDITVDKPGTYGITVYCKRLSGRDVVPYFQLYDRNANKGSKQLITNLLSYRFVKNSATLSVENPNGTQIGIIIGINSGTGEVVIDDVKVEKLN